MALYTRFMFLLRASMIIIGINNCAGSENDTIHSSSHSPGKIKLLELFPLRPDNYTGIISQSQPKGKEILTQSDIPFGEGTSTAVTSMALDYHRKKSQKPETYIHWSNELIDDLLYLSYKYQQKSAEKWKKIQDILYRKYGEYFPIIRLKKQAKAYMNRMLYNSGNVQKGETRNDPRIEYIRIYYQTRDGGESGQRERMHKQWLQEHPEQRDVPIPDMKAYVEEMIRKSRKITSKDGMSERAGGPLANKYINWKPEYIKHFCEVWESLSDRKRNRGKELHRRMSERFPEIESLPQDRVYLQAKNVMNKVKKLAKRHKSGEFPKVSHHEIRDKQEDGNSPLRFTNDTQGSSSIRRDNCYSSGEVGNTISDQRSQMNKLDLSLRLNSNKE